MKFNPDFFTYEHTTKCNDFEVYKHVQTGQLIQVPIELKRHWEDATVIKENTPN